MEWCSWGSGTIVFYLYFYSQCFLTVHILVLVFKCKSVHIHREIWNMNQIQLQIMGLSHSLRTERDPDADTHRIPKQWCVRHTYRSVHRMELFQHVRDDDLQQSFSEELLPHCAAVVVKFLPKIRTNVQLFDFFWSFYYKGIREIQGCFSVSIP